MLKLIDSTANIVDGMVVLLLIAGLVVSGAKTISVLLGRGKSETPKNLHALLRTFRIDLGHFLLVGLELLIISDILHSIVHRTMEEIAILAVTVIIRISLSFFLNKEIVELSKEQENGAS